MQLYAMLFTLHFSRLVAFGLDSCLTESPYLPLPCDSFFYAQFQRFLIGRFHQSFHESYRDIWEIFHDLHISSVKAYM